jgi:hypothetical protein
MPIPEQLRTPRLSRVILSRIRCVMGLQTGGLANSGRVVVVVVVVAPNDVGWQIV